MDVVILFLSESCTILVVGYTLGALDSGCMYTEVAMFTYEDKYLLDSIDTETLPVIWIDLLQGTLYSIHSSYSLKH